MLVFLVGIALLPLPTATVSLRTHLPNSLKLKCNSLLHRSIYIDDQCYFAILEEIEESKATKRCSKTLQGAKAVVDAHKSIFAEMMVDKSKFRQEDHSGGIYTICAYETGYKCDKPETMLNSGKCIVRAAKKMNFADANNFCQDRGMEIPAPANDLENRIVRDVLNKDPVWVQKALKQANKLKWSQVTLYSRWTTCDMGSSGLCNKDSASVIDRNGYWSNGGVQSLMDVVCVKPAVNEFTQDEKISCDYHAELAKNLAPLSTISGASGTCYTPTRTSTRYDIIGKATVETRRGCEVLCDTKPNCAGFSFKEAGFSSSCALLTLNNTTSQLCSSPATIFLKTTTGCVARTNLTAEFGVDPCTEEIAPITQTIGVKAICPLIKHRLYVIRAIDASGRRITFDNDYYNWLSRSGDMWAFNYQWPGRPAIAPVPIVAAACAIAGGEKCPCKPLEHLNAANTRPAKPNVTPPCKSERYLFGSLVKMPSGNAPAESPGAIIRCMAGMWISWRETGGDINTYGILNAACSTHWVN